MPKEIQFDGLWDDVPRVALPPDSRHVELYPDTFRLFGYLSLWREKYEGEATIEPSADFSEVSIMGMGPLTQVRAEWWRRALYVVIARPIRWAQRGVRRCRKRIRRTGPSA